MTAIRMDGAIPHAAHLRSRVLLVDDEPRVLDALSRTLRRTCVTVSTTSGREAIAALSGQRFAVIISDMRMPEMDGAEFLARARVIDPDAVRILLTGHADLAAAASAVNEGEIFRFLRKPCPSDVLEAALGAACERHRSLVAERTLLQETLSGSIKVLTDVLAIANPVAFSRALRVKRIVSALAEALSVPDRWQVEVAAMLSQLGAIAVAPPTLERAYRGAVLDADEKAAIAAASNATEHFIRSIPRLEPVRDILRLHTARFDGDSAVHRGVRTAVPIGARILRAALDCDTLESGGNSPAMCADLLRGRTGEYDPAVLDALREWLHSGETIGDVREVRLADVRAGMVFARDVVAANGLVLIGRGQEATTSLLQRIRNYWIDLPLKTVPQVIVPSS